MSFRILLRSPLQTCFRSSANTSLSPHQYLHQLEPEVRHAVIGNAGTIISFRVGSEDAAYLAPEFQERFEEVDLLQFPNFRIYLKLTIDGTPSLPFSALTLEPETLGA